jgi:hypothetical protein
MDTYYIIIDPYLFYEMWGDIFARNNSGLMMIADLAIFNIIS